MPAPRTPLQDLVVLAIGQALTSTVTALLTAVSSLSGERLAPSPALSTLPVTATVLGALAMVYPASALMARLGRRSGFMLKAVVGIAGGLLACVALWAGSFALLVLGTFLLGVFSAFGQYYRFAAIDATRDEGERTRAVSLVMGAGVAGGIAGPWLGERFSAWWPGVPYAGAFAALAGVCVALAVSQLFLSAQLGRQDHAPHTRVATASPAPLGAAFYAAALCAIGFAVMTLVMNAAPLAMHRDGHSMRASSVVLQAHFALMYLPAFAQPWLVARLGLRGLVAVGIAAGVAGALLAQWPQQSFALYLVELGLAGAAWSFIFNGGTLLSARTYAPAQRARAQGVNSTLVYLANVAAAFAAGGLLHWQGWAVVNLACLPLLGVAGWLMFRVWRAERS
ncbi:MFS transporter [Ottowia sp.]|jgi:MFS family permease|uniref:MFS transporter n=1 Tax=Ottowia sp. TaxID=1898956 RepID=UPI0025E78AEF|nr:MFS transporter [Ottowia sp.]MBK6613950.1 MFS transporter [Ottowia sp.]